MKSLDQVVRWGAALALSVVVLATGSAAHANEAVPGWDSGSGAAQASPQAAPNPPDVSIGHSGSSINLSWEHPDVSLTLYQIWRSEAPYFDPDQNEGALLDSLSFQSSVYGEWTPFGYVDDGACGYFVISDAPQLPCTPQAPTVTVVGDVAHNYFWVVRVGNDSDDFAISNRVGEFDYALVKGN